ncbi:MAG: aspartate 1-decarboxylase [Candidatus Omnitrophica bacterium]|nr:aspartate 1-decarboxylase [Candidatus Omnitrophota bacterium]
MMRTMLKSKIHRARVTDTNLEYEGSITIDQALLEAADILPNEKVEVLNLNTGSRIETYAIVGKRNSGVVCLNGPAARSATKGDIIIILSYVQVENKEASLVKPIIVKVDERNRIND